ncbi:MAG TPA: hypothetical protein VFJ82_05135 [Longimicrobium sp.]|nr:hypothetical protein [Longimicrobium sp.]
MNSCSRLLLAGLALLAAAPRVLRAQDEPRVLGSFAYWRKTDPITDEDKSAAMLRPRPGTASGLELMLTCNGDALWMHVLSELRLAESTPMLVYRYDRDAPDTTVLLPQPGMGTIDVWLVPVIQQKRIAQRMRTATSLVIRVFDTEHISHDYFYDLGGAEKVLAGLSCARWAPTPEAPLSERQRERVGREEMLFDSIDVAEGRRPPAPPPVAMPADPPPPQDPTVAPDSIRVYQPTQLIPYRWRMLGSEPLPAGRAPALLTADEVAGVRLRASAAGANAVLFRPAGNGYEAVWARVSSVPLSGG